MKKKKLSCHYDVRTGKTIKEKQDLKYRITGFTDFVHRPDSK
jgi:hypothetical protein